MKVNSAYLLDPGQAWWLKCDHANTHSGQLAALCRDFRTRGALEVVERTTSRPGVTEFVFRQHEPFPPEISLAVGDVLHALRSALDSLVYGIVLSERGELSESEERACQFPIAATPTMFDKFITERKVRDRIYSEPLRKALSRAQPFYWREFTRLNYLEIPVNESYEDSARNHPLCQIAELSNIDKHRRLPAAAAWPALRYYMSDESGGRYSLTPVGPAPWVDGAVVARLSGEGRRPTAVVHECHIALVDVAHWYESTTDLPDLVASWIERTTYTLSLVVQSYLQAESK